MWAFAVAACMFGLLYLVRVILISLDNSPTGTVYPPLPLNQILAEARAIYKPPAPEPQPLDYIEISAFIKKIMENPIDQTAAAVLRYYLEDNAHSLAVKYNKRFKRWQKWDEIRRQDLTPKDRRRLDAADERFRQWIRYNFRKYR